MNKKLIKPLFILLVISLATLLSAQTITIGTGTEVNGVFDAAPVNIYWRSIRTQTVYTVAELNAQGVFGANDLMSIAYYVTGVPIHSLPNFQIRVRHTTATDGTAHIAGPYQQVYVNPSFLPVANQWNLLTFTTPFEWNGVENILIDTAFDMVPAYNSSGQQRIFTSPNGMRYARSDSGNQADVNTTMVANYKPQIQMTFTGGTTYVNDMAAMSVAGPLGATVGTPSTYSVTVRNMGTATQNSYTVKLMTTGDVELATYNATTSLAQYEQASFDLMWTPTTQGTISIWGRVVLTGDENAANNNTQPMSVMVYPAGTANVIIGTGTGTSYQIPFNFFYRTSVVQTIYYDPEIYVGGLITHLTYFNNFTTAGLNAMPTKIWIGETTQNDLSAGWISATEQTLVFDGLVAFPTGQNEITLTLDPPIFYGSGNIVVTSQRVMDTTYYSTLDVFYISTTTQYPNRTRHIFSDTVTYDPNNMTGGTLTNTHANTRLTFMVADMGSLDGYVYDQATTNPIQGAVIHVEDMTTTQTTNMQGFFYFGYVPVGTHDVTATKFGYYDATTAVTIIEDQTTSVNFNLITLPQVTVSGQVVGSDAPTVGLVGAEVELVGYDDYYVETIANGNFSIPNVYADQVYTIHVSYPGYQTYTAEVVVGNTNLNLGVITVNEIATPPTGVEAVVNAQNNVDLIWNMPGTITGEEQWIHWDSGENNDAIGTGGAVVFDVAARFTPTNIEDLNVGGLHITTVKFWPYVATATYTVKVWTGGSSGPWNAGTLAHSQLATGLVNDAWNEIELTTPVLIDPNQEIWIGYEANTPSGYPAGCDAGPHVDGYGNLIYFNQAWDTLVNLNPALTYNWNIQGWAGMARGDRSVALAGTAPSVTNPSIPRISNTNNSSAYFTTAGKENYSNDYNRNSIGAPTFLSQMDQNLRNNRSLEGYVVYRFLSQNQGNENLWTELTTITTPTDTTYTDTQWPTLSPGVYQYGIKAIYTNNVMSPPAFSNTLEHSMNAMVTVNLTTNSGDPVLGGQVTLTNNDMNPNHVYTMTAPASGILVFPNVWRGTYMIEAALANHEPYVAHNINILTDTFMYPIEMIEILLPAEELTYELFNENNVTLNWLAPGSTQLDPIMLRQHSNSPQNAYYQSYGTGYGVVFNLADYPGATLHHLDFRHSPWGINGTWQYKIHVVNWATFTTIQEIGPLSTTLNNGWEMNIDLNQIAGTGGMMGIMLEAMSNSPTDAYPCYDSDDDLQGYSAQAPITNWSGYTMSTIGDFLIDLWIVPAGRGELVQADKMPISKIRNAETVRDQEVNRAFVGYKVVRNDVVLVENLTDLTYTDSNVPNGTYVYGVMAQYTSGDAEPIETEPITILSADDDQTLLPMVTALKGNYPNPFNPDTNISFSLHENAQVVIEIYNVRGQKVRTLVNTEMEAGNHSVVWNGRTDQNREAGSGIFFYRMKAGTFTSTRKMILMK